MEIFYNMEELTVLGIRMFLLAGILYKIIVGFLQM
jgi:hypothetical protein